MWGYIFVYISSVATTTTTTTASCTFSLKDTTDHSAAEHNERRQELWHWVRAGRAEACVLNGLGGRRDHWSWQDFRGHRQGEKNSTHKDATGFRGGRSPVQWKDVLCNTVLGVCKRDKYVTNYLVHDCHNTGLLLPAWPPWVEGEVRKNGKVQVPHC